MRTLILLWIVFIAIGLLVLAMWYITPRAGPSIENERQNVMEEEARNEHSQLKADLGGILIYRTMMEAYPIHWIEPAEWSELAFYKDYDPEEAYLEIPVDVVYVFDDENNLVTFGYFSPGTATKIDERLYLPNPRNDPLPSR